MAKYKNVGVQETVDLVKALADEPRVRALMALRDGELCVCQIVELLELAPSTVSKHMSILRRARLVEARKAGRWRHYRRPERANGQAGAMLRWLDASLADSPEIRADRKRLARIKKIDPEELCRNQCRS